MKVGTFAHTAELTLEIPDKHARGSRYASSIRCDKVPVMRMICCQFADIG